MLGDREGSKNYQPGHMGLECGVTSFICRPKEVNFDQESSSVIKLTNGTVMYLREVTKFLALVCILREDSFDRRGEYFVNIQSRSYGGYFFRNGFL